VEDGVAAGGRGVIVQVDRVASVEEAMAFRDAGASLIGIALDPDPRFADARFVSPATARAIREAIAPARLVGLVPGLPYDDTMAESRARIERVLALGPGFVQFYRSDPPDELVPMVRAAGVPVIKDGPEVDGEHGMFLLPDDPAEFVRWQVQVWRPDGVGGWRLPPWAADDPAWLRPALCHLDVVTDRTDPWRFLSEEAFEWPEDSVQVADIAAMTRALPLLLSLMGLSAETIGPYVRAFPDAPGFFARLGPDKWSGPRSTQPGPLLAALRVLHADV